MHSAFELSCPAQEKLSILCTGRERGRPTGTSLPCSRLVNVDLPGRVMVPEGAWGQNGNNVLFVVDVRHRDRLSINVVCECLVSDARQPVPHKPSGNASKVKWQIHFIKEGERCAYGIRKSKSCEGGPSKTAPNSDLPNEWPVTVTLFVLNVDVAFFTAASTSSADLCQWVISSVGLLRLL